MHLSEAFKLYEVDKKLLGYSPHTLKAYTIQSNLLIRYFGDIYIEEVRYEQLKMYLASLDHLKPSSVGHRVRFLKSLFRWAQDEGYITKNPAAKLREPKTGKRIPKALSEEDIELLREGCISPLEHSLIEFLYTTGCRIGEVQLLNRNTIDWDTRSVIVHGKGDKEREVYFNIKCSIWLKKYLKERADNEEALFVTERRPIRRLSISRLREIVKRVAKRANIKTNVYPHKMRHSYSTHLLNNGAPLELIQEFLGHQKLETTRLYCQLSGQRRRDLYQRYF